MTDNALLKLEILYEHGGRFFLPKYPSWSIYKDWKGWTTHVHVTYHSSLIELIMWLEEEYG